jgi:hypothetical protein
VDGKGWMFMIFLLMDIFLFLESTDPLKRKKIALKDWPVKSSHCCYDCCHPFSSVPLPMIHTQLDMDKKTYHVCVNDFANPFPVFCSLNCLLGFIAHSNLHQAKLNHNAKMMMFWQDYYFASPFKLEIKSRHSLKMFGGNLTIGEYRKDFCQFHDKRPIRSVRVAPVLRDIDSILWPVQMPNVMTVNSPLVSLDDPTEAVPHQEEKEVKTSVMVAPSSSSNSTVDFISNILHQTLNTRQVTDLTSKMQQLAVAHPPPAKKQKTMEKTIPTASSSHSSHSSSSHPLFSTTKPTLKTAIKW